MVALAKNIPAHMSVDEFLAWCPDDNTRWQLVDGEPRAMAPATRTHGAIQSELAYLLTGHFRTNHLRCSVIGAPGVVPHVQADWNFRIPDLAVTCSDYQEEEQALTDPVLIVEILSPSNARDTWANVWTYTTVPSVQEIVVVRSATVGADLLRRLPDGSWPDRPLLIRDGAIAFESVGLVVPLAALYRTTRLAPRD